MGSTSNPLISVAVQQQCSLRRCLAGEISFGFVDVFCGFLFFSQKKHTVQAKYDWAVCTWAQKPYKACSNGWHLVTSRQPLQLTLLLAI
jgi:hypothetical protein